MNESTFQAKLSAYGIELTETQLQQFTMYYELLTSWNEKMNLTSITELTEVYEKHFYDSLSPSFFVDFRQIDTLCDVGAGAGFPSIPLKICFPHLQITIIDSLKKRLTFLEEVKRKLHLTNVSLIHGRAEDIGQNKQYREYFSCVTARAVASMSVLAEYCLPLCKKDGLFIALKGAKVDQELADATRSLQILGGEVVRKIAFTLPIEQSERSIVLIKKIKQTPSKYPRKAGTPAKKPL